MAFRDNDERITQVTITPGDNALLTLAAEIMTRRKDKQYPSDRVTRVVLYVEAEESETFEDLNPQYYFEQDGQLSAHVLYKEERVAYIDFITGNLRLLKPIFNRAAVYIDQISGPIHLH